MTDYANIDKTRCLKRCQICGSKILKKKFSRIKTSLKGMCIKREHTEDLKITHRNIDGVYVIIFVDVMMLLTAVRSMLHGLHL